jgi:hypothetical protein
MNYYQYALMLENKNFETSQVSEAAVFDMNNQAGLDKIKSGENGGAYATQWNQLIDAMVKTKGKPGQHKVQINHDSGKPMIMVSYTRSSDGKVDWNSLSFDAAAVPVKSDDQKGSAQITDEVLQKDVDTLVDDLDGYVAETNLKSILAILTKYVGKSAVKDDDTTPCDALGRLTLLYKRDESGNTLTSDVDSIGSTTFSPAAQKDLSNIKKMLAQYSGKEEAYA